MSKKWGVNGCYYSKDIETIIKERDYYKARYLEFNNGIIEGMKTIERQDKKCLHCGSNTVDYCEECFQKLVVENLKLQEKLYKVR